MIRIIFNNEKHNLQIICLMFFFCTFPLNSSEFSLSEKILHYSANGYTNGIMLSLKEGASADSRDKSPGFEGETPLMKTALNGDIKNSQILLDHGADINAIDERGESALLSAVYIGNFEMVKFLLGKGANINHASSKGFTALLVAADKGYSEIVDYLLEKGAKIQPAKSGYNILMAVSKYHPELIDLFLKKGVDVNAATNKGQTPVMEAVCAGNQESLQILLKNKASIYSRDTSGRNILYYFLRCYSGSPEYLLEDLVKYDGDFFLNMKISEEDSWQILEKYYKTELKNMNIFEKFVQSQKNVNLTDKYGFTFLDELYLQQRESRSGQGGVSLDVRIQNIEKMIMILTKYGGVAPHRDRIQKINQFHKKLASGYFKITDAIRKEFFEIIPDIDKPFIERILNSIRYDERGAYFQFLTERNWSIENYFNSPDYVIFLCKSGKENILLEYYEKNYPDRWSNNTMGFQKGVLQSCSIKFLKKMIEKKDRYLSSLEVMDFLTSSNPSTNEYYEKINIILDNQKNILENQSARNLVYYLRKRIYSENDKNFNIHFIDKDGNNVLHILLQESKKYYQDYRPLSAIDYSLFRIIIKNNININAVNNEGKTPLILAAQYGFPSVVKTLIEAGADPDISDRYHQNALFLAVLHGHTFISRYLQDRTKDKAAIPFVADMEKNQNLDASTLEKYKIAFSPEIKKIIENQKNTYDSNLSKSETMVSVNDCRLYHAVEKRNIDQVNFLLESGYYPDCVKVFFSTGYTPLELAISQKNADIVKRLLRHGARVNSRSGSGHDLLQGHVDDPEILKMLYEKNPELRKSR